MRGQAEAIIVLGIIVIAAVVIIFTTQRELIFPPSSGVATLRDAMANEIEQNLYSKTLEILETIGEQGGYIEPPEGLFISFQGSDVPYWQYAGQSLVPDLDVIENNIAIAISSYANQMSMAEYQGKTVSTGSVSSADVTIAQDSVNVKIWQPITLEGYSLPQPFEFSIQTGLGKAYDTASQIAKENIEGRYLDYFTIASIFLYGVSDGFGNPKIPSFGILTECGKILFKNWFDVKDDMELLVQGFLARTYMAGQTPENILEKSNFPVHVFPLKTNIQVSFKLAEPLTSRSFQFNPNPVRVQAEVIPMTAICLSPPYLVHYWLLYPVVTEVEESGYTLKFGLQVYVDDNKPGNWGDAGIYLDEWTEQIERCEFTRCSADLLVEDMDGPVRNAEAIFSGCYLGRTDNEGRLQVEIPCGMGLLEIYKDSRHEMQEQYASDEDLASMEIYMFTKPLLTFNIFNMEFTNASGTARIKGISRNANRNVTILATTEGDSIFLTTEGGAIVTQDIAPGMVGLGAYILDDFTMLGGLLVDYIVTEEDSVANMYIPTLEGGIYNLDTIYDLQDILTECDVFMITEEPLNETDVINRCGGSI